MKIPLVKSQQFVNEGLSTIEGFTFERMSITQSRVKLKFETSQLNYFEVVQLLWDNLTTFKVVQLPSQLN